MKIERPPSERLQELDARHDQALADLDALQARIEATLVVVRPAPMSPATEALPLQSSGAEPASRKKRRAA